MTTLRLSLALILSCISLHALEPIPGALFARVVDVGAGLCVIIKTPDDRYIIYDAGNYEDRGRTAIRGAERLIPNGSTVDLMILSHSDSDHLAAVPEFCTNFHIKEIIHCGLTRETATYGRAITAIQAEVADDNCAEIDLSGSALTPGKQYQLGDVTITVVCGWNKPLDEWGLTETSEINNAGSIVARVDYLGKSILLCGDSVGRHIGDDDEVCIAAEKFMVDGAATVTIDSDVIVAPHHGADNGSSTEFIRAVTPEYVIFSAGHKYRHPRKVTAQRYYNAGVKARNMFRTDRGDDEGADEWRYGGRYGGTDVRGDDDVDVLLKQDGTVEVNYRVRPR